MLSSLSSGLLPLCLLALNTPSQVASSLYFYSGFMVCLVAYRAISGLPFLTVLGEGATARAAEVGRAASREILLLVCLAGLSYLAHLAGIGSSTSLWIGAAAVIFAGDAARYAQMGLGRLASPILGDAIWLFVFASTLPFTFHQGAGAITTAWLVSGTLGSLVPATAWLARHSPRSPADALLRFRAASFLELGVERTSRTLAETVVGLLGGPVAMAMIQLGRTLWSPIVVALSTIQSLTTRALAAAKDSERPRTYRRATHTSLLILALALVCLISLALLVPSGELSSDRADRLLAIASFGVYFAAVSWGMPARVAMRVTNQMRNLVAIQVLGGLGVLVLMCGAAMAGLPWYGAIAVGNLSAICVAWAMRTRAIIATTYPAEVRV